MSSATSSSLIRAGIQGIEQANRSMARTFTRLASGSRLNSASDDTAGSALAAQLDTRQRTLGATSQALSYSQSILTAADATAQQVQGITGRLAEITTQAANGTYSAEQRAALQAEYDGMVQELQRLGEASGDAQSITINPSPGTSPSDPSTVSVGGNFFAQNLPGLKSVDLSTADSSRAGLAAIDTFSQEIEQYRSNVIGSTQSRLEYVQQGIAQEQVTGAESLSRITDIDVAQEMASLVQNEIRVRANAKLFAVGRTLDAEFMKALLS